MEWPCMSKDKSHSTRSLIGQRAPNFTLESSEGEMVSLSDFDGQWKVVFFYSLNGSPTCKRGCLNFKEQYSLFRSVDCEIIGISQDPKNDHKEFKEENELPFPILGDPNREAAKAYGVSMHLGQFPSKSSFVIAPDGTIRHVYDWLFRPRTHVAKILAALSDVTDGGRFE
ncbi:MAG TPA: peroxiredoxin [Candidatus Poseidoniales archaeon]|nr:MAG TPA: peroxiredoxin [Candidatus Poseidoniales archaeon]